MNNYENEEEIEIKAPSKKKPLLIALAVLVLLAGLGAGIYFLVSRRDPPPEEEETSVYSEPEVSRIEVSGFTRYARVDDRELLRAEPSEGSVVVGRLDGYKFVVAVGDVVVVDPEESSPSDDVSYYGEETSEEESVDESSEDYGKAVSEDEPVYEWQKVIVHTRGDVYLVGYIPAKSVIEIALGVTLGESRLRAGPGLEYSEIGTIASDLRVIAIGKPKRGWRRVAYRDSLGTTYDGYCREELVEEKVVILAVHPWEGLIDIYRVMNDYVIVD